MEEKVLANQFKIIKLVASGCSAQVYEAINLKNGKSLAIKIQRQSKSNLQILNEQKIYQHIFQNIIIIDIGIPQLHQCDGQTENGLKFFVLDLLGHNLDVLLTKCGGTFTVKTVLMIADQMISRIQFLHRKGILHRDIQPSNFVIGSKERKKKIYLLDFDLSKKYMQSDKHIKMQEGKKLVGTARFMSLNNHLGLESSRRDDLQSLVYCWAYFLYGKLPWQGLQAEKGNKNDKIMSKKLQNRGEYLFKNLPIEFMNIAQHIGSLEFEEEPNYELIKCEILNCMKRFNYQYDFCYDWTILEENKNNFSSI